VGFQWRKDNIMDAPALFERLTPEEVTELRMFGRDQEVKQTKGDLWTMFWATVIQLLALALSACLFVATLHTYDTLKDSN
jgi:hypothetical protein